LANWDLIFPYGAELAGWLDEMGHPRPAILSGNRLPSTADMKWALEQQGGLVLNYPEGDGAFYVYEQGETGFTIVINGFDWDKAEAIPEGCFAIRWMCDLQAAVLVTLCRKCGQLSLIQDSGGPAVVFEADMDPARVAALHRESDAHGDSWAFFFNALYGEGERNGRGIPEPA